MALLTIFLMGIIYCLAVPGRTRTCTEAAAAAVVAVFALARLYLGVDHPGDVLLGVAFAVAIAVTAFAQVRPSPWRQAVDLGNMMLVLAVRTDPQRVYRRALAYFTEAELAEAFAATRGVASPAQLRAFMKRDPRDLLGAFSALAPQRPPIVLQPGVSHASPWPQRCSPSPPSAGFLT